MSFFRKSPNKWIYALIDPEPNFKKKGRRNLALKLINLKVYWPLLFIPLAFWIGNHFSLVFNQTDSLPQKVWLLALNQKPKTGDYVAFKPPPKSGIPKEIILHKQVLGVSGDIVSQEGRDFFINGKYIATAKTHSLKGEPLALGPVGTLKEGQYYVSTPHPDSFDSRYKKMGWINSDSILGVLYPLW